jgi:hypothetical protein
MVALLAYHLARRNMFAGMLCGLAAFVGAGHVRGLIA